MKLPYHFLLAGLIVTVVISGCGARRDLSTPSARIVGHWKGLHGDEYIKPMDAGNNKGVITSVGETGYVGTSTYKVVDEVPDGERVVVAVTLTSGSASGASMRFTCFLSKDGKIKRISNRPIDEKSDGSDAVTGSFDYVDNQLEP